jgi:hypothetical protein
MAKQQGNDVEKFGGECVGGPYDKQLLVHWAKTKKFYRPMLAAFVENAAVESVEIGEYRLNDFGVWHWWPTDSGKAFDQLFGPAKAK